MIYYRPTDGDPQQSPINWKPKTAFVIQQLAKPVPPAVLQARKAVESVFNAAGFSCIDAMSRRTGRDLLLKVWEMTVTCPVGVAIVQQGISESTLANIYYELGLMQAYGRETVVIKVDSPSLPSDFVRTEYIEAGPSLETDLGSLLKEFNGRAKYYENMAEQLENDPLLSIDFLRRAYLLNGDSSLSDRAKGIFDEYGLKSRARGSVERLLVSF